MGFIKRIFLGFPLKHPCGALRFWEWSQVGFTCKKFVLELNSLFGQFLQSVRKAGVLEENVGPAIVHCSAGIGRSGTFCLVDCCLIIVSSSVILESNFLS